MNITPPTDLGQTTPPAGTIQATMETIGNPFLSNTLNANVAYDFKTMLCSLTRYRKFDFKLTVNDGINNKVKTLKNEDFDFILRIRDFVNGLPGVSLMSHRYFTGAPCMHFYLPKMDIQTGVLEFRYLPMTHKDDSFGGNSVQTNVTQWDISQQNYFVYQVPSFQPFTRRNFDMSGALPNQWVGYENHNQTIDYSRSLMNPNNTVYGRVMITIGQPLVSGNIAPLNLQVYCFVNFPDSDISTYCGFRAGLQEILS